MRKLVIFDFDGTLVDSEVIAAQVFPKVWAGMGLQMTEDEFLCNFVGVSSNAEIVVNTMKHLPPDAMKIADQVFDAELEKSLQPILGIPDLLAELPHQLCVASNSSMPYLNRLIERTKLRPFFEDRIFSGKSVARPKPHPDVFEAAARALGFQAKDCIVVEDSVAGIRAAQAADMKVVGFMGGQHFRSTAVQAKLLSAHADVYCRTVLELRTQLLSVP